LLLACAGTPPGSPGNDLVVGAVSPPSSAQPIAPSATMPRDAPPMPTTSDARPIAARMRDELLASAASQAAGGQDLQLYQDAIDRERADDLQGARKAYYELITQTPSSALVPYAYLAFGDLFFGEAEHGSPDKLALAKQAYEKVIASPPPGNRAYAYAWQRLGACDLQMGDHARALSDSKKAMDATRAYPTLPLANDVAELARRNVIEAYAVAGQADRAPTFFRAVDSASASAMVVELGERYVKRGASRDVLALYANALASGHDEVLCRGARAAGQLLQGSADPRDVAALESTRSAACGP
jgi:tetratricopeptide (TPR) repeat protein